MKSKLHSINQNYFGLIKRTTLVLGLMFCFFHLSFAQSTVTGTVIDDTGEAIIGASVLVTGTTTGTVTDIDGSFSINVPSDRDQLTVSYIGYQTQIIDINGRSTIDLVLGSDTELLDEIVVVGYGVQKKSDLTGAVASIKGSELTQIVTGNPTSVLQGKLSGVQVESFGGQPGAPANVFVRGVGSLTNTFPLYVIDGTFAENINFLNPNDIESVEVLKDASSAAIYGSRASNGVVLITTKAGNTSGKTNFNLTLRSGFETPSRRLDFLNSEQFLDFRDDLEANDATGFRIDRANFTENGQLIFTDWQDESFETGSLNDVGFSVSGGGENSQYYISSNYYQQGGILVGSGFERLNLRANSKFNLGKFTISQSLGLSQTETQENEYFGFEAATAPILRLNNPNNLGGFEAPERETSGFGGLNNFALASLEDNLDTRRNLIGNISAGYELFDGFTAKINLGAEYTNVFERTFRPTYFLSSTDARFNDNPQNDLTNVRGEFLRTQVEPTLNYAKSFTDHNFNVVVGASRIVTNMDFIATYVGNLPSNSISTIGAAGTSNILGSAGARETDGLLSVFGRVNYDYKSKYLVTATLRQDATSKFAPGFRSDIFPSFSVGWKISNEDFFNQNGSLSSLKARFGFGELGAQNVGNFLFQSTFGTTSGSAFGNSPVPGFAQTDFANESLQWETSTTVNAGLDFEFAQGKFGGTVEWYQKDIDNLLVAVPIPSSNGTSVPVTQNAGGLLNSGIEIELFHRKATGAFQYNIGLNLGTQNSTLDQLPTEFFGPSVNEGIESVNIFREGEAPGSFFGFEVEGIDPATGEFIFADDDGDGGPDAKILGSPVPDFTYGLSFSGSIQNFDFNLFFNGVQGNEIYNQARAFNTLFADGNKLTEVLDRWTPENPNGSFPRASAEGVPPNSFFVEDGSYFRLKNFQIGYDLGSIINGVESVRISLTAQNLFVITGYTGYDPDVASTNGARSNENDGFFGFRPTVNSITGRGIDIRAYPNARSLIFGLNFSF